MKYFISSLGFWSKNVTSILNKNILLLNKKMYSIQLCTVNLWLYFVWVFLSGWYVLYASCVLQTFNWMLSKCFYQVNMYSMQLCVVNLLLYVACMFLSCLCVLYTAVCCQPLILCCMRDFVTIIFILYSCVMSIFDFILSL